MPTSKSKHVTAKLVLTALLILFTFAIVLSNSYEPETATTSAHIKWMGIALGGAISAVWIFCIWFWK